MTDAIKADQTKQIAVLGAAIDIGASQRGTLMGPAALRTAGLLTLLDGLGFEVKDHGDVSIDEVAELADEVPDSARHYREIQRWTRALTRRAYELARSGAIPSAAASCGRRRSRSRKRRRKRWRARTRY